MITIETLAQAIAEEFFHSSEDDPMDFVSRKVNALHDLDALDVGADGTCVDALIYETMREIEKQKDRL
jgi:hypothetical protein